MRRRAINPRFINAVLADKKTSTIRDNPWPLGVPIMLYNWIGAAYRSKQNDVAPIIVSEVREIKITHREDGGMIYSYGGPMDKLLHEKEGFESRSAMNQWFQPLVRPGKTLTKHLMIFSRSNEKR